jgi:hypothetical protein
MFDETALAHSKVNQVAAFMAGIGATAANQ